MGKNNTKKINVAILGAGSIAVEMAKTLNGLKDDVIAYAVASRDIVKAQEFAKKWNFIKAYGSYEELVKDENVDLVYVATPHSHHFEHAKLCIENGKAALVEKAFTANERQAKELITLAEEKKVLLTEAIWTRYLPARNIIMKLIDRRCVGDIKSIKAEFSVPLTHIPRMREPSLAGGALLDLGIYPLTFASMYFGDDIVDVETKCEKYETGVDGTDIINYTYRDGRKAYIRTSFISNEKNQGTIIGSKGSIVVEALNNYLSIHVYDENGALLKECDIPEQITGYEYEVLSCKKALEEGKLECEEMPHTQTLEMMRQMDYLRGRWGVRYPFE